MQALLEVKKKGLTREIGIFNLTIPLMEKAIAAVGAENIATNQIELSPYLQSRKAEDWAKAHNIHITSYMILDYDKSLKRSVIYRIVVKYNATAAQVILAWAIGKGYAVIQMMAIYSQHPQSRLFRFCTGKYKWSGSICHYAGRGVQDIYSVLAVFAERRQDRHGPYVVLRSVTLN